MNHLIVTIHWGNEYQHTANYGKQIEPGRAFVDAGADIVIGHHPHVVQNFEIYNNKLIFYSLGNFVFDQYWSKATQEQLGLGIIMEKDSVKVHLLPMISKMSQPRLMTTEERKNGLKSLLTMVTILKQSKIR